MGEAARAARRAPRSAAHQGAAAGEPAHRDSRGARVLRSGRYAAHRQRSLAARARGGLRFRASRAGRSGRRGCARPATRRRAPGCQHARRGRAGALARPATRLRGARSDLSDAAEGDALAGAGSGADRAVEAAHRHDSTGGDRWPDARAPAGSIRRRRRRRSGRDRYRAPSGPRGARAPVAQRGAGRLRVGAAMHDRYARQAILPEVGAEGQARLASATAVVVGAGGLGCAVLQYLTAAGVGRLTIVDHDRVEESNLHRQPLYRMSDLGGPKVHAARAALLQSNPEVRIDTLEERLGPANAARLVARADVVIDAADSFAVTYVLSDACRGASTPAGIAQHVGHGEAVGGVDDDIRASHQARGIGRAETLLERVDAYFGIGLQERCARRVHLRSPEVAH